MTNDEHLWQRFRDGDRVAFESLIRDHYRALFSYGRKFMSDPAQLTDCIHDLFTSLWERRRHLGPTGQIRPYLLRSLRNRIIKELQRAAAFSTLEDQESAGDYVEPVEVQMILDEQTEHQKHQVSHILNSLTRRQREVIFLKFYQNLNNDEIAGILSISRPAVANLLHLTLRLFRERWEALLQLAFALAAMA